MTTDHECDQGWVFVDATLNTVRPCEICNPDLHRRWVEGEFAPSPWHDTSGE